MRISRLAIIGAILVIAAWLLLGLLIFGDLPYNYRVIVYLGTAVLLASGYYLIYHGNKRQGTT
jgi:uncharacterized RDD family membrane protein YckC